VLPQPHGPFEFFLNCFYRLGDCRRIPDVEEHYRKLIATPVFNVTGAFNDSDQSLGSAPYQTVCCGWSNYLTNSLVGINGQDNQREASLRSERSAKMFLQPMFEFLAARQKSDRLLCTEGPRLSRLT